MDDIALSIGRFFEGVKLETCTDLKKGISRPRVKPIELFDESVRVEFPRKLREIFPIGTQFLATVKVCQKHLKDGTPKGEPYLRAYDIAIVPSSIKDEGLLARVKEGSISELSYEYHFKTK